MKKLVALLLVTVLMLTCLAGCGKKENWMPYELEFGMTYDEAKEAFADMPALEAADANDGYVTESPYSLEGEEINAYFKFLKVSSFPTYSFSFNEDKKLYEFYCFNSYSSVQDNPEKLAEDLFNSYVEFYNEKIGTKAEENEYSDGLEAVWKTETVEVSVHLLVRDDGGFIVYSVVHNNEYDFE